MKHLPPKPEKIMAVLSQKHAQNFFRKKIKLYFFCNLFLWLLQNLSSNYGADCQKNFFFLFACFADELFGICCQRIYLDQLPLSLLYLARQGTQLATKLPSQNQQFQFYLLKLKKEYFLLGTYLVIKFKFQIKMNYSITFKFFNNFNEKNSKTVTGQELPSFQKVKGTGAPTLSSIFSS